MKHLNIKQLTALIGFVFGILFFSTESKAQILINDFNDAKLTGWVSGSSKIVLKNDSNCLKVTGNSVGAAYEGFGNYMKSINMTRHTKILMKIMVPKDSASPIIRVDLCDNNGYYTNANPVTVKPTADGQFHEYILDFKNRFSSNYPTTNLVNASKIVRLYLYFNAGSSNYKGTVFIDDIIVEGAQDPELIKQGDVWSYLDDGSAVSADWNTLTFDDASWKKDSASFGYGNGTPKTIINYGNDPANKPITTYFRKKFNIVDTSTYKHIVLNLLSDDGAIAYLNGKEIYRYNMPQGTVLPSTTAEVDVNTIKEETTFQRIVFPESILDSALNILAVEVHQSSASTDDMAFDCNLSATENKAGLIRCPYLQMGSDKAMMIRWRTLESTPSRVRYGLSPNALNSVVDSLSLTDEHKVIISGLQPETKYYYCVGNLTDTLSGADTSHYFITAPIKGKETPITIWACGDAGYGINDQRLMRNSYYKYIGKKYTNLWLILGDNAYSDGTDEDHQLGMFENMFEDMLAKTVCWSTPGNHDIRKYRDNPIADAPYYKIFSTPQNGESGGVASKSPAYYSFDYGNVHVVSLESNHTPRYDTSAMAQWLKKDLAANTGKWLIAFLHHPPYTKGSHNSDDTTGEDLRCTEIRKYILPILEEGGVDLVLAGHSHVYERSHLINGFYGFSKEFLDSPHIINEQNSGRKDSNEVYVKNPVDLNYPNKGAVFVEVGCSGFIEKTVNWAKEPTNYISKSLMYTYTNSYIGSMAIDINKDTLTARFLNNKGVVVDNFSIVKDKTKTITLNDATVKTDSKITKKSDAVINVYPNPFVHKCTISYTLKNAAQVIVELHDSKGNLVKTVYNGKQSSGTYSYDIKATNLPANTYFVVLNIDNVLYTKSVVLMKK